MNQLTSRCEHRPLSRRDGQSCNKKNTPNHCLGKGTPMRGIWVVSRCQVRGWLASAGLQQRMEGCGRYFGVDITFDIPKYALFCRWHTTEKGKKKTAHTHTKPSNLDVSDPPRGCAAIHFSAFRVSQCQRCRRNNPPPCSLVCGALRFMLAIALLGNYLASPSSRHANVPGK